MKDLYDLTEFSRTRPGPNLDNFVIAAVVHTEGSAYRRAGARTLLKNGQKVFGTISGGCLEESIADYAIHMPANCRAKRVSYDSRSNADLVFGTATGCGGLVSVLLKRWEQRTTQLLDWIDERLSSRLPVLLATVIDDGNRSRQLGEQMAIDTSGQVLSQINSNQIHAAVMARTAELLCDSSQKPNRYQNHKCTAGHAELLLEYVPPKTSLLIIGAGEDAQPVVDSAKRLGWSVTVIDHRPAYLTSDRFPQADNLLLARPESYSDLLAPDPWTVSVVMTHNWHHDAAAVAALSHFDLPYIGLIGSAARSEKIMASLESLNGSRAASDHAFYYPAGLDVGAQGPEEIALAVVSEIQAVLSAKPGGSLKHKQRKIHERDAGVRLATT